MKRLKKKHRVHPALLHTHQEWREVCGRDHYGTVTLDAKDYQIVGKGNGKIAYIRPMPLLDTDDLPYGLPKQDSVTFEFEVNNVEPNEALYDWVTSFTEDRGCPYDNDMCCGECEEEIEPLYVLDLPEQLFRIETTDPEGFIDSVESITEINDFVTPSGRYYEGEVDVYRRGEDNE